MKIEKVKIIKNEKGKIYKLLSFKKKFLIKELYFNEIQKNKETFWIRHLKSVCKICILHGKAQFQYLKNKKIKKINILGNFNKIIFIKPKTWFKVINKSKNNLIIMNMMNYKHCKNEYEKKQKIY